jgi:hypothetical protein
MGGSLFTLGVKHGYIIVPFWTLTGISLLASIPTWWLEEGKGFGDDPDSDSEDVVSATASSACSIHEERDVGVDEDIPELEYGEPTNLLSVTSTHSSAAVASDDEPESGTDEAAHGRTGRRGTSSSMGRVRTQSQGRRSKNLRRRSSVPVGMGIGFRRLSSNLGSTGIGAGGASWGGT